MTLTSENLTGYEAALRGAALYVVPDPGYLRVQGEDQQAFIQRQTTNDARQLAPGQTQQTVLTSATARILDVWRLVPEQDATGVITLAGRGARTARYLQSRIFFMDKVAVTDASAAYAQIDVFGPQAADVLRRARVEPPAPDALSEIDGVRVIGLGSAWRVLVPIAQRDDWSARLGEAGAVTLGPDAYHVLRVEMGQPGPERELTDDFTPLEANLDRAISDAKGCYTGQEIIARQITYDKITRRLAGVRLESAVPLGSTVTVEGRTAGEITSVVESPRFGPIALAVIKRPHHAAGTAVQVRVTDGETVGGMVSELPFG